MITRLVKAILVFLGVIFFLTFNSGKSTTVLAQAKNPFGLMIGAPNLTLSQRIALVKDLGAVYFRPNSVFLDKWNGNCNECEATTSEGIGLILTIRNNGGLGQPTTPPLDYNTFRQTLTEILDKYPPELLVVENEENSAALFYDGTAQEYLQELSVACEVAHGKGIKCTNGGLVSMLVVGLVANHYLEQGDAAKADEYLRRALSPEEYQQYQNIPEATKQEQLLKGKTLLAGYKASGADFVNFHWYNADTPALEEAINFLQGASQLATITNEVGQHNEDPQQVTDVMGKIVELNMPYAVWFSVDSNKARALIDTNGNLRPNGEAFKKFIEDMSIKGDIDKDGDVDIFDYNLLVTNFGSTNCGNVADIDKNCKVDIFDYNILLTNFGKTSGTPTTEPTPTTGPTVTYLETGNGVSFSEISKEFYSRYEDDYDFLAIFNDFGQRGQWHITLKNTVEGIGMSIFDNSATYGSSGRLKGIGYLGYIKPYYDDEISENVLIYNALLEEIIAHQWGVDVGDIQDSNDSLPVRNTLSPYHWTPCMSFPREDVTQPYWKARLWKDNGDGTWTIQRTEAFSRIVKFDPFMLYLMGFLSPEEVAVNATLITPNSNDKAQQCAYEKTVQGTARPISINDIIEKHGPRNPPAHESQKNFSIAYILLVEKGVTPSVVDLEKLTKWGANFPEVIKEATSFEISPTPTPSEVTARIELFTLPDLRVKKGTKVTWVNLDNDAHTTTYGIPGNPSGLWDSSLLNRGESFSYTFNEVGTCPYFCRPHPFMQATVTVIE